MQTGVEEGVEQDDGVWVPACIRRQVESGVRMAGEGGGGGGEVLGEGEGARRARVDVDDRLAQLIFASHCAFKVPGEEHDEGERSDGKVVGQSGVHAAGEEVASEEESVEGAQAEGDERVEGKGVGPDCMARSGVVGAGAEVVGAGAGVECVDGGGKEEGDEEEDSMDEATLRSTIEYYGRVQKALGTHPAPSASRPAPRGVSLRMCARYSPLHRALPPLSWVLPLLPCALPPVHRAQAQAWPVLQGLERGREGGRERGRERGGGREREARQMWSERRREIDMPLNLLIDMLFAGVQPPGHSHPHTIHTHTPHTAPHPHPPLLESRK